MEQTAFSILEVITTCGESLASAIKVSFDCVTSNPLGLFYTGVGVVLTGWGVLKGFVSRGV